MGNTKNKGKTCRVLGCEGPARAKELCNPHYLRWIKSGRVDVGPSHRLVGVAKGKTCSKADCTAPVRSKGLCARHYDAARRTRTLPHTESVTPTEKICTLCGEVKPIKEFGWRKDDRGRSKLRSRCRTCESAAALIHRRAQQAADPEGYRQRKRESAERTYQSRDPETRILRSLMTSGRILGVNRDTVLAAWEESGNVCQSCGDPCTYEKRVVIDHCHRTGVFRGLLCQACNVAAGWIRDSPERARKLATYLERPIIETEA